MPVSCLMTLPLEVGKHNQKTFITTGSGGGRAHGVGWSSSRRSPPSHQHQRSGRLTTALLEICIPRNPLATHHSQILHKMFPTWNYDFLFTVLQYRDIYNSTSEIVLPRPWVSLVQLYQEMCKSNRELYIFPKGKMNTFH
jgi:hypothetical protein